MRDVLAWWERMLRELLPRRWREAASPTTLVVRLTADTAHLTLHRRGRTTRLAPLPLQPDIWRRTLAAAGPFDRAVLELDTADVIERAVTLPLAAERDPGRVLRYEMDRLTPFTAEEVNWSWQLQRRDRALGRLIVSLAYIPKARVAEAIDTVRRCGVAPAGLQWQGAGHTPRHMAFDGAGDQRIGEKRRVRLGFAICAALALIAAGLPFLRLALARNTVEHRIAALSPRLHEAEATRARLQAEAAGADGLAAERLRNADALATLATLTRLLPDDAYLTDLRLSQRQLSLEGHAASAAALLSTLARDPALHDPAFTAAVTPTERGSGELFAIRAEVTP